MFAIFAMEIAAVALGVFFKSNVSPFSIILVLVLFIVIERV